MVKTSDFTKETILLLDHIILLKCDDHFQLQLRPEMLAPANLYSLS